MEAQYAKEASVREAQFNEERKKMAEITANIAADNNTNSTSGSSGTPSWHLNSKDIICGTIAGRGQYGEVFQGKLFGKTVAIKKFLAKTVNQETLAAVCIFSLFIHYLYLL